MRNLFLLLLTISFLTSSAQVTKLTDPNPDLTSQNADLQQLTVFQGNLYAYAQARSEQGLWKLDTLTDQMELVVPRLKIYTIKATSQHLFLFAAKENEVAQIWVSDGTASGTQVLPGMPLGSVSDLLQAGDQVFFNLITPTAGIQLHITDGTATGTQSLGRIFRNGMNGFIGNVVEANNAYFFFSLNGQGNIVLMQSDGTPSGTVERYQAPNWSPFGDQPRNLIAVDSFAYFIDKTGSDIFLHQVRQDTVVRLAQIPDASYQFNRQFQVHPLDGHHYFMTGRLRFLLIDTVHLSRVDANQFQPERVATFPDLRTVHATFATEEQVMMVLQENAATVIRSYDGTSLSPERPVLPYWNTTGRISMVLDTNVVFAYSSFNLAYTDGTEAGTDSLVGLQWRSNYLGHPDGVVYRQQLYLSAGAPVDFELYRTNGTNWELVQQIENTPINAGIDGFHSFPNQLLFSAYNDSVGQELWTSDGTAGGTEVLVNLLPDAATFPGFRRGAFPQAYAPAGNQLYFIAADSADGYLFPYVTDGTASGTRRVSNYWAGDPFNGTAKGAYVSEMAYWKGNLFFIGATPDPILFPDQELYLYDPAVDTSGLLKNIEPNQSSRPHFFTPTDSYLFFVAKTLNEGEELWRTDGTLAGTQMIGDLRSGGRGIFFNPNNGFPVSFANMDSYLLFTGNDGIDGWQLWRSDGTALGTFPVKDSLKNLRLGHLQRMGNKALFVVDVFGQVRGTELWLTDGTDAGTEMIFRPILGRSNLGLNILYADAQTAFFSVWVDSVGRELWKTDGTTAGTQLVSDVAPGTDSSNPTDFTSLGNGKYLFWADNELGDRLLWETDGTNAGTQIAVNYLPSGAALFREREIVVANGFVYFVAEDAQDGESLFRFDLSSSSIEQPVPDAFFQVYPNPTAGSITLDFTGSSPALGQIQLLNLRGQVVQGFPSPSLPASQLALELGSQIANGVYLLRVETEQGTRFAKVSVAR